MRKVFLTTVACLMLITNVVCAAIYFEDDEGFSYIADEDYIVFSPGNRYCTVYDLSSIDILEDNDDYFKFSITRLTVRYNDKKVETDSVSIFREDYKTGEIYVDDTLIENKTPVGLRKTKREIYYKIKSVALD